MRPHRTWIALAAIAAGLAVAACEEIPVSNDTEDPTVSIASPGANSTATDSLVVTVDADDNVLVAKVEIFLVGLINAVAVDTTPPYVLTVPLADVTPGPYQFYAVATDGANNQANTAGVAFTSARTPGLRFLSRISVNGSAVDVAASGNLAVLAGGDGGVIAVDISNIYLPRVIGRYRIGNPIQGVAVSPPVIYAGAGDGTVLALSVSTPDTLISTAQLVVSGIQAGQLDILNSTLSVAAGGGGLLQLNASQTDTLIELGRYDQNQDVRDVELVGQLAYIAEFGYGMRVIDVSDPDSMNAIGSYVASGATDLYILGTTAYLALGNNGVQSVSIANPAAPVNLGSIGSGGGRIVTGVKGQGRWLYTANGDAGVEVIDANNPVSLQAATGGSFNTIGFAHKVAAHNSYVLVADNEYFTILKYVEP